MTIDLSPSHWILAAFTELTLAACTAHRSPLTWIITYCRTLVGLRFSRPHAGDAMRRYAQYNDHMPSARCDGRQGVHLVATRCNHTGT